MLPHSLLTLSTSTLSLLFALFFVLFSPSLLLSPLPLSDPLLESASSLGPAWGGAKLLNLSLGPAEGGTKLLNLSLGPAEGGTSGWENVSPTALSFFLVFFLFGRGGESVSPTTSFYLFLFLVAVGKNVSPTTLFYLSTGEFQCTNGD